MIAAAVAHHHAGATLTSPTIHSAVRKVFAGIKRQAARPVTPRGPLTFSILEEAASIVRQEGSLQGWRTLWRLNMQFYALLRWDEVSALRARDFNFHADHMDIRIKRSKTDQFHQGAAVRVARLKDAPHACPVNLTWIYLRMLKYPEGVNGLIQPRIRQSAEGQGGWANSSQLFQSSTGPQGSHQ